MIKPSGLRLLYGKCSNNIIRMLEANASGLALLEQRNLEILRQDTTWMADHLGTPGDAGMGFDINAA